jgi:hypothetical protein
LRLSWSNLVVQQLARAASLAASAQKVAKHI